MVFLKTILANSVRLVYGTILLLVELNRVDQTVFIVVINKYNFKQRKNELNPLF